MVILKMLAIERKNMYICIYIHNYIYSLSLLQSTEEKPHDYALKVIGYES